MSTPLRRRTVAGISLLAIGIAALVVGIVIGIQDAVDRNFGRPRVLKATAQTINGVRDEQLFLIQRPWPLFWKTATGYGFWYLQGQVDGRVVWTVKEGVVLQVGPGLQTRPRIVCTSIGFRAGTTDILQGVDCECWDGQDCAVADLEYLVRIRTEMGVPRSHPHVPLITRHMAH